MPILAALDQDSPPSYPLPDRLSDLLTYWGLGEAAAWVGRIVLVAGTLLVAFVAFQVVRRLVVRALHKLAAKTRTRWDDALVEHKVFQRLTHLVPALVFYLATPLVIPDEQLQTFAYRVILAYMVAAGVLALNALLHAVNRIYEGSFEGAKERPIKSYIQVVQIFFWALAAIFVLAALMGRSPWALLGGLGAMTAVLMLVFKDSILGLVASIQLTANNMVQVGDWIEMPQHGADGNIVDVSLATVKVQNWDKTITTVPTYKLISDAFKNWRGMSESGVRRIRRPILIDVHSVKFVDREMLERFKKIQYIREHLDRKIDEIERWNKGKEVDEASLVNGRRLTNLGTFRAYVTAYLQHHPRVRQDMTLMVHQQTSTEKGQPLVIYCFTDEQRWAHYEAIKADIFDHILAVVPEFDLRLVQMPTGADLRSLAPIAGERS